MNGEPADTTDVRQALDRVLASPMFAASDRLSRLLRFTVEQTLDGQGERLKEYVLGVEVFDRDASYDPRLDSIVRVEARRLRGKLAEYYAGPGAGDPVAIRFRKGSYVPTFDRAPDPQPAALRPDAGRGRHRRRLVLAGVGAAAAATAIAWLGWSAAPASTAVSIAVLPMVHYTGDTAGDPVLAERLTDGVTTALARNPALAVVSRTSARHLSELHDARALASVLEADLLLEATIHSDGPAMHVQARLVDGATDRKFWVGSFDGTSQDLRGLEERVAAGIGAAIAERLPARLHPR